MKDFLKNLKLNESNIGFGLGVAVMILTGLLLVNYFKSVKNPSQVQEDQTLSTSTDQPATDAITTPKPTITGETLKVVGNEPDMSMTLSQLAVEGGDYKVAAGDSLWKIAAKEYGNGYAWSKIYDANKDVIGANPSTLTAGITLKLPKVDVAAATTPAISASETKDYMVVKGDSLWKIAVAQCDGNGYAWSAIAKENNISTPGIIYSETKLKITCPAKPATITNTTPQPSTTPSPTPNP